MVVSRVVPVSVPPPLTQLPRVTSVRLMRPEIGAVMRQKLSSSSAVLTRASATFTAAVASRTRFSRSSKVFLGDGLALEQRPAALDVEARRC